jgi:hypothetical protein
MKNWDSLRKEIYYLDGSLRDILVRNVTREDWKKWINLINTNYSVEFYNGQTQQIEAAINPTILFDYWDKKTDLINSATIKIDHINIKCYFFDEREIENDITPIEINNIDDHNKLLDYLKDVANTLDKIVVVTPENISKYEKELMTIRKDGVSI